MTEYSTSASAIEEYMNSQQRLRLWLTQGPGDLTYYSPNIAPCTLPDADYVPPPPSDVGSSHSEPPNMVLHWPDGRPDEPLREYSGDKPPPPHSSSKSSHWREKTHASPSKSHTKSHSHPSRTRGSHAPFPPPTEPTIPRDIPAQTFLHPSHHSKHSYSHAQPSHHSHSTHTRSRSLPRPSDLPSMGSSLHGIVAPPVDLVPMGHASLTGLPQGTQYPTYPHTQYAQSPNPMAPAPASSPLASPSNAGHIHFSSTPRGHFNTWSARSGHKSKHRPPAIVYAPSSHSQNYLYSPPTITPYHPSYPIPPGSVIYSHSAPNPPLAPAPWSSGTRHPTPYPSTNGTAVAPPEATHHSSSRPRRRRERDKERREKHSKSHSPHHHSRSHSRSPRSRSRSRASATKVGGSHNGSDYSLVDAESDGSGSTYYVLPAQGQKVLVIAPEHSMLTSPATCKARLAPAIPGKKPLLQRLRDLRDVFSSSGSSKGTSRPQGRRLHRRHSADVSGRPR